MLNCFRAFQSSPILCGTALEPPPEEEDGGRSFLPDSVLSTIVGQVDNETRLQVLRSSKRLAEHALATAPLVGLTLALQRPPPTSPFLAGLVTQCKQVHLSLDGQRSTGIKWWSSRHQLGLAFESSLQALLSGGLAAGKGALPFSNVTQITLYECDMMRLIPPAITDHCPNLTSLSIVRSTFHLQPLPPLPCPQLAALHFDGFTLPYENHIWQAAPKALQHLQEQLQQLPSLRCLSVAAQEPFLTLLPVVASQLTALCVHAMYGRLDDQLIQLIGRCTQLQCLEASAMEPSHELLLTWSHDLCNLTTLSLPALFVRSHTYMVLTQFQHLTKLRACSLELGDFEVTHPPPWKDLHLTLPRCLLNESTPPAGGCSPLAGLTRLTFESTLHLGGASNPAVPCNIEAVELLVERAIAHLGFAAPGACTLPGVSFPSYTDWGPDTGHESVSRLLSRLLAVLAPSPNLRLDHAVVGESTAEVVIQHGGQALDYLLLNNCSVDDSFWRSSLLASMPKLSFLSIYTSSAPCVEGLVAFCSAARRDVSIDVFYDEPTIAPLQKMHARALRAAKKRLNQLPGVKCKIRGLGYWSGYLTIRVIR